MAKNQIFQDMLPFWKKKKKKKEQKTIYGIEVPKKRQPDLVKKLDRVFSLYIRLRDVMPNGYGRCIACGRIKPFSELDCGHYFSRVHMATRWDEDNTNIECKYCLTPDALILTSDLRWMKLGDMCVGDEIFAFEEERSTAQSRYWKKGVVTHLHREVQDVYDVELENGDHIYTTAEHKWLARRCGGVHYGWVMTKDLWFNGHNVQGKKKSGPHTGHVCSIVCKPFLVVHQEQSFESGWLAGMIDADGHICQQKIHDQDGKIRHGFRIGVAQSETYPEICKEIVRLLEKFTDNNKPCRQSMDKARGTFQSKVNTWQYLVTGTNVEKIMFLQRVRPLKMSKVDINKLGIIRSRYDTKVKDVSYIGKREVVVMETDTHTFIANGYAMHNCNRMSADHLIGYRDNLLRKIGAGRYDRLNLLAHSTKHWMDCELEAMINHYTAEVKRLCMEKGIKVKI